MSTTETLIQKADFSPKIKTYIKVVPAFFMLISIIGIPILIIWLLGLGHVVAKRYYANLDCQLTNRHLAFKKGVFFRVEKTIPLENIQDLTFIENPILRAMELKILKIETAGNSNPHGSDMRLMGILEVEAFKTKVLEQRAELQSQNESGVNKITDQTQDESIQLLREIRDLLKEANQKG